MSLLLEALKKAALEKQRKLDATPLNDDEAHDQLTPHTAAENDAHTPAQTDDMPLSEATFPGDINDFDIAQLDPTPNEDHISADAENVANDDVIELDIDIDESYLDQQIEALGREALDREERGQAPPDNPHEVASPSPQRWDEDDSGEENTAAPRSAPVTETEEAFEDEFVEPAANTGAAAPAELESRKQALSQLIQRSRTKATQQKRKALFTLVLLALSAAGFIGFYYYQVSQSHSTLGLIPARSAYVDSVHNSDDNAAEDFSAEEENTQPVQVGGEASAAAEAQAIAGTAAITPEAHSVEAAPPAPAQVSAAANSRQRPTQAAAPKSSRNTQQHITTHAPRPDPLSEAIHGAYAAFQRGDLAEAEALYKRALQLNPQHRDAVLGAAAVAAQRGDQARALRLYQERLARAPRDEYARMGLISLNSETAGPALMSSVNALLRDYPEAAHLHFLQGNLLAAQSQWQAAQNAYFLAWQKDDRKADYCFNLAVALDHLNQPKEALRFYRQALTLNKQQAGQFSPKQARERVKQLQALVEPHTP